MKTIAQQEGGAGINFQKFKSWDEVLNEAQKKNKYILVDCYTTWCGPCKSMEQEVYNQEQVGKFINSNFISLKLQLDSTVADNELTKEWYKTASEIQKIYAVESFPTYLFFSTEGKLMHRYMGRISSSDFVKIAGNALDPHKQYCQLADNYKKGIKYYPDLRYVAIMAREFGDRKFSKQVGHDYLQNYLYKQSDVYNEKSLKFISEFIQGTKEKGFNIFYKNSEKADKILADPGFSKRLTNGLIIKTELFPRLWKNDNPIVENPNWKKLYSIISLKYDKNSAERTIVDSKIYWYQRKDDWENLALANIHKIEKYGLDTSGMGMYSLNNMVWDVIFKHSTDINVLNKGIEWMKIISEATGSPVELDTYANVLYKAGRVKEAIEVEKKAIVIEKENAIKNNGTPDEVFENTLRKMIAGEKTW